MLSEIKSQLDSADPRLFHLAIAVLVGGVVFAFKRLAPGTWARLPKSVQIAPALVLGAVLNGATATEVVDILIAAATGAVDGLIAIGGHHAAKRLGGGNGGA